MTTSARWAKIVLIVSSIFSLSLSLICMAGWFTRNFFWVTLIPTLPIFPLSSYLSLVLLSAGLLGSVYQKKRLAMVLGGLTALFGLICLVQSLFHLNLHGYNDGFRDLLPSRVLNQISRLGTNASLCFALGGFSLILTTLPLQPKLQPIRPPLLATSGAILVALGAFSLLSSISSLSVLESWVKYAQKSIQVPPLFLLIGIAILSYAWLESGQKPYEIPSWLPLPIGIGLIVLPLVLWESLLLHEQSLVRQAIEIQTDSVKNEILSRIDFSIHAIQKMSKRWETLKNPTSDMLTYDVGVYVSSFHGCSSIERLDGGLKSRWIVSISGKKPDTALENRIRTVLGDIKTHLFLAKPDPSLIFTRSIQISDQKRGFVLCFPIFKGEKFDGFIYSLFQIPELLDSILTQKIASGYQITAFEGEQEVYRRYLRNKWNPAFSEQWAQEIKLSRPPATWRVQICPSPEILTQMASPIPMFALISGFIIAILFTLTLQFALTAYNSTSAVRRANNDLQKEISIRLKIEDQLAEARDQALESAKLKAEFVANMSHEIRTPLNGIIGMSGLLMETQLDPKQKEYSEMIRSSSSSLLNIVNDILDFSKIEAGKLTFEELDFDLNLVLESVIDLFSETVYSKNIDLSLFIAPDVPLALQGDPGRLRQVLTNLVGNAVKFTEKGGIDIEIHRDLETDEHVVIRAIISDSGIGIPPQQKKLLFKSFSQIDTSTTRKYGGTGLGLTISKQLIEQMNGEIDFQSVPDKGSTFWFTVQLKKQSTPSPVYPFTEKLKNKSALIVEHNPRGGDALSKQLRAWGIQTTLIQKSGEILSTLKEATSYPFTWILLNLQSDPQLIGGTNLYEQISKQTKPLTPSIIGMSTFLNQSELETLKKSEMSVCIFKPLKPFQLREYLIASLDQNSGELWKLSPRSSSVIASREKKRLSPSSRPLRILVVEDNVVNQKVALRQLEKLGHTADAVGNGIEALKNFEQIPYDLILMDCQMSEMDGYEAAAEIRKREGDKKHTPIIAMTAHALDGDREKCLQAGMDDYLSKPVDTLELKKTLERWSSHSIRTPPLPLDKKSGSDPVDLPRLKEITNNDPREIKVLINLFVQQTSDILTQLQVAIKAKSSQQIILFAHKGSGSSSSCGMTAMASLFQQLEQNAEKNTSEKNNELFDQILLEFQQTQSYLKQTLKTTFANP